MQSSAEFLMLYRKKHFRYSRFVKRIIAIEAQLYFLGLVRTIVLLVIYVFCTWIINFGDYCNFLSDQCYTEHLKVFLTRVYYFSTLCKGKYEYSVFLITPHQSLNILMNF